MGKDNNFKMNMLDVLGSGVAWTLVNAPPKKDPLEAAAENVLKRYNDEKLHDALSGGGGYYYVSPNSQVEDPTFGKHISRAASVETPDGKAICSLDVPSQLKATFMDALSMKAPVTTAECQLPDGKVGKASQPLVNQTYISVGTAAP